MDLDGGTLFLSNQDLKKNIDKIDLIIDLQSKLRNTIILKRLPHENFYSTTLNFFFCTKKIENFSKNHLENLKKILSTNIKSVPFNLNMLSREI